MFVYRFIPIKSLAGTIWYINLPLVMKRDKSASSETNRRFDGTDELATYLGKSPSYVRKLAREKIIPYLKLPGRDKLFDRAKVLDALSRFEVKEIGR